MLICAAMLLALCACGSSSFDTAGTAAEETEETVEQPAEEAEESVEELAEEASGEPASDEASAEAEAVDYAGDFQGLWAYDSYLDTFLIAPSGYVVVFDDTAIEQVGYIVSNDGTTLTVGFCDASGEDIAYIDLTMNDDGTLTDSDGDTLSATGEIDEFITDNGDGTVSLNKLSANDEWDILAYDADADTMTDASANILFRSVNPLYSSEY